MQRISQLGGHLRRSSAHVRQLSAKASTSEIYSKASTYGFWVPIQTRWNDNDNYGHVNNAVYYEYFDTTVNIFLNRECGHSPLKAAVRGLVVNSSCTYLEPISYPMLIRAGMAVEKLGNSSVTYRIGIFYDPRETEAQTSDVTTRKCAAYGSFVHVFVSESNGRPTPIPEEFRSKFKTLLVPS
ncbi:hypothetical protein HDU97_003255 [Phlyctochytrium planicorne]|nr:hypothetical protein HDU97_003255 [Phlyctochytrium planicorne]